MKLSAAYRGPKWAQLCTSSWKPWAPRTWSQMMSQAHCSPFYSTSVSAFFGECLDQLRDCCFLSQGWLLLKDGVITPATVSEHLLCAITVQSVFMRILSYWILSKLLWGEPTSYPGGLTLTLALLSIMIAFIWQRNWSSEKWSSPKSHS